MQTILLAALLGALCITIVFLWQLQRTLRDRDAWQQQVSRENAEKLQTSLDQKVTLSMSVVSDRLQQVNRSLGTLESLSRNVGELKKVMSNVKNRGIWGELQLGQLLADMLAADQYGTNVAIRPRSQERVEFAIRLPGKDPAHPVWLPIDAPGRLRQAPAGPRGRRQRCRGECCKEADRTHHRRGPRYPGEIYRAAVFHRFCCHVSAPGRAFCRGNGRSGPDQ